MSEKKKGVIIGVDPHKMSVTIEVVDTHEQLLGAGRFDTTNAGYAAMQRYVKQWPDRLWAVEGANGAGRPLAQRLVAAGEQVVDVQRSSRPGCGSSTPVTTARPTRWTHTPSPSSRSAPKGCGWWSRTVSSRPCGCSPTAATSSPTSGSRRSTGCSACSANSCLASANETCPPLRPRPCWPRCGPATSPARPAAGWLRRRSPTSSRVDAKLKKIKAELKAAVLERGSTLMDIYGVGPAGAARVLADVGDVARFADRNRFASWTGTAPLDASSGEQTRHRCHGPGTGG